VSIDITLCYVRLDAVKMVFTSNCDTMLTYILHTIADSNFCIDLINFQIGDYNLHVWLGLKLGAIKNLFGSDVPWLQMYDSLVNLHWSIDKIPSYYVQRPYLFEGQIRFRSLISNHGLSWPTSVWSGHAPNPFVDYSKVTLAKALEAGGNFNLGVDGDVAITPPAAPVLPEVPSDGPSGASQASFARVTAPAVLLASKYFVSAMPSILLGVYEQVALLLLVGFLLFKDSILRLFRRRR
jgi:hypothetical protein